MMLLKHTMADLINQPPRHGWAGSDPAALSPAQPALYTGFAGNIQNPLMVELHFI